MCRPLDGKIALVTGASRGLGRTIALELARRGARVAVNYLENTAAAAETIAAIEADGGQATAFQTDVADFQQAQALVRSVTDTYGRLDILVNNAGTTRDTLLLTMTEEDWDTVIRIDLKSVFNVCKAVVRGMMRQRSGRIINVSSVIGIAGMPGQTNYAAAKAGIIGFTKSLAKEVGPRGITVNAIAPGLVITDLTASMPPDMQQAVVEHSALRRLGRAEEIAYVVAFLASDEASFITGAILPVDGGLVMSG